MTAFSDNPNQCGQCKFFGPCAYLKEHNGGICDNPNSDHFDHYITFTHVACGRFSPIDQTPPEGRRSEEPLSNVKTRQGLKRDRRNASEASVTR